MGAMMKASYMQDDVAAVRRLGDDVARRVHGRARAAIEVIEAANRVDWLPLRLDIALTEAIHAEVGDDGTREHARLALKASLQSPLLRPFKLGAFAILRATPHSLLKLTTRGWPLVFKDTAEPAYAPTEVPGARGGQFVLDQCPPELVASPAWIIGTAGFLLGMLDEANANGRVDTHIDAARGQVRYELAW
jgi:hypothetical protein